jgi:hypothetical protein
MAHYVLDEERGQDGVPPGWCILDVEGEFVVINAEETHAVQFIYTMVKMKNGACFALFERKIVYLPTVGYGYSSELEFNLRGWTTTYEGGEQWLRGEIPDLFIRDHGAPPMRGET